MAQYKHYQKLTWIKEKEQKEKKKEKKEQWRGKEKKKDLGLQCDGLDGCNLIQNQFNARL